MRKQLIILGVAAFTFACAKAAPLPPKYFDHIVSVQGETLAAIAKWYTGDSTNWAVILDHNPGLDVRRMRIGTEIQIPDELVIRTDPFPRKMVMQASDRAEQAKAEAAAAQKSAAPAGGPATQFVEKSTLPAPFDAGAKAPEPAVDSTAAEIAVVPDSQIPPTAAVAEQAPASTEEKAGGNSSKSRDELLKELLAE